MAQDERIVTLARIGAPHGLRGEARVKSFTDDPMALGDYGSLHDREGRRFVISSMRPSKGVLIVKFDGIDSREAAEALNGVELHVVRSALPDEAEDDAFYHADLIGMAVVDEDGSPLGKVRNVDDYGAGDVLEIALSGGGTELITFTRDNVPRIDVENRVMVVRLPESVEARPQKSGENQ